MRFTIFAFPRTGSTSLIRALAQHPEVTCLEEPFNPQRGDGADFNPGSSWQINYSRRVAGAESIAPILEEIFEDYTGIKHLANQLPAELNERVLATGGKIILLWRRNLLQRIVSNMISTQANHWSTDRDKILAHEFEPLHLPYIKHLLQTDRDEIERYRQLIRDAGCEVYEVTYEELYGAHLSFKDKLERINDIFEWLGVSAVHGRRRLNRIRKLMDPRHSKLNTVETYLRIPGIDYVESELGHDETGWLFKDNVFRTTPPGQAEPEPTPRADTFMIVAFSRTGSSTLLRCLNRHPGVSAVGEPFHPRLHKGRLTDPLALDDQLEQILRHHNGFKHITNHIPRPLNRRLLTSGGKVILLWRRNALQRVISREIAKRSQVWGKGTERILAQGGLPAANIDELRQGIEQYRDEVAEYRALLVDAGVSFFELCYEDLYGADVSMAARLAKIDEVLTFLGFGALSGEGRRRKIEAWLDPSVKLNSEATYRLIPNVEEIDRVLGGPEVGYLLPSSSRAPVERPSSGRPRRILVISPAPSHPQNAGNRSRIHDLLSQLQRLGHEIHFVYDDRESNIVEVRSKPDVGQMVRAWDDFHYAPIAPPLWQSVRELIGEQIPPRQRQRLQQMWCGAWPRLRWLAEWARLASPAAWTPVAPRSPAPAADPKARAIDEWYNPHLDRFVRRLHAKHRFDVVLVEYVFMSRVLDNFGPEVVKIIDTHDVFTDRYKRYERFGIEDTFFTTSAEEEAKGLRRADKIIAIQDRERDFFRQLVDRDVVTIGHSVALRRPARSNGVRPARLLFVGSGHIANVHGIRGFIEHILPTLRQRLPQTELLLAGGICDFVDNAPGLIKLGEVAHLHEAYGQAQAVVNPVVIGTGLKIKSVEALGYGKPLISSPHAAEGLGSGGDQACLVAELPEEYVAAIERLFTDPDLYEEMARRAFEFAEAYNRRNRDALRELVN